MKRASETTPKRHSIVPIVASERRLRWGQVLGTGSRMSGDAQGPSREGRNEEVNEQICRESVVSSAPPASRSRCSAASWSLESLCLSRNPRRERQRASERQRSGKPLSVSADGGVRIPPPPLNHDARRVDGAPRCPACEVTVRDSHLQLLLNGSNVWAAAIAPLLRRVR
jgi:hypothetical protein